MRYTNYMNSKTIQNTLINATEGILGTVTDLSLTYLFFTLNLIGAQTPYQIHKAHEDAQQLVETINYKAIKQSIYTLTRSGLIQRSPKRTALELTITKQGLQRIHELLPSYRSTRTWDGYLYLVSYDIPSHFNAKRNLLRTYLKQIGCALLQESLWLTPYNPKLIIEKYIDTHNILGTVLVSKLGHDGSIGDETLSELISRIYNLKELEEKYSAFIRSFKQNKNNQRFEAFIAYQSILKTDPQLPFELEPKNLKSREAHTLYQQITNQT
jgi:DNA-binding transcriptional regulator PaaX